MLLHRTSYSFLYSGDFVGAQIVYYADVPGPQRRTQDLLHQGVQPLAIGHPGTVIGASSPVRPKAPSRITVGPSFRGTLPTTRGTAGARPYKRGKAKLPPDASTHFKRWLSASANGSP